MFHLQLNTDSMEFMNKQIKPGTGILTAMNILNLTI